MSQQLLEPTQFAPPRDLVTKGGDYSAVSYGTDDGLIVEFFVQPYFMEFLSEQMGTPIYQDRIMTRIIAPGNNKTVWVHETKGITYETTVDPESQEYETEWKLLAQMQNGDTTEPGKYPKAWARFNQREVKSDMGFPIEEWSAISRSMAASLKQLGIPTVEALAALTDVNAQSFMGGYKFRNLARATLDERERNKIVAREQTRADQLEGTVRAQAQQIAALTESVNALTAQLAHGMQHAQPGPGPMLHSPPMPAVRKKAAKVSAHQAKQLAEQAAKQAGEAA